jgi:hypothetical protein
VETYGTSFSFNTTSNSIPSLKNKQFPFLATVSTEYLSSDAIKIYFTEFASSQLWKPVLGNHRHLAGLPCNSL